VFGTPGIEGTSGPYRFIEDIVVTWHHLFLAVAVLAFLFPASRRFIIETVRSVVAPLVAVLFFIAMRLR
jgi:hypothetical protein